LQWNGSDFEVKETSIPTWCIDLSVDGQWLAATLPDDVMRVVNLENHDDVLALPAATSAIIFQDWSPDGTRLAVALADGTVALWNVEAIRSELSRFGISFPSTATHEAERDGMSNGNAVALAHEPSLAERLRRAMDAEASSTNNAVAKQQRLNRLLRDSAILNELLMSEPRDGGDDNLAIARAIERLESLSREFPASGVGQMTLFRAYVRLKQWSKAAQRGADILSKLPDDGTWNAPRQLWCVYATEHEALFEELLRLLPTEYHLAVARGWHFIPQRDWKSAAAAYGRVPTSALAGDSVFEYVCLQHLFGNESEVNRFLKETFERTPRPTDQLSFLNFARAAAIAPQAAIASDQMLEFAKKAVETTPQSWHWHALALVHYRIGNYREAIRLSELSERGIWGAPGLGQSQDFIVMAMASHQLGEESKARKYLTDAHSLLAKMPSGDDSDSFDFYSLPVPDFLGAELLRREADALINGAK
jgi:tetratricopeptide (TPR) repeat protein